MVLPISAGSLCLKNSYIPRSQDCLLAPRWKMRLCDVEESDGEGARNRFDGSDRI